MKLHIMPWYTAITWEKVRAVSLDPDSMGNTFDEWLKAQNEICKKEESVGATVNKVNIDPDKLMAWATRNRLDIIYKNRLDFAFSVCFGKA